MEDASPVQHTNELHISVSSVCILEPGSRGQHPALYFSILYTVCSYVNCAILFNQIYWCQSSLAKSSVITIFVPLHSGENLAT